MDLLHQDPNFPLMRRGAMQGNSPSLSTINPQNKSNFTLMGRQQTPCGSILVAPSLVPTCSEAGFGTQIRDGSHGYGGHGHYRRIGILRRRVEAALDAMDVLLRRKPKEPDGQEELERRRTRSVEFLSRFSRNYLFQLHIQVMELKRQVQSSVFAGPERHAQQQLLLKKLVAAYQTAVQGLQACLNQLPGSLRDSAILSKLDQLLCHLCELTSLKSQIDHFNHSHLTASDPSRQDNIMTKAQNLVAIVRKKRVEREDANEGWRETAAVLARKRFGLPSQTKSNIATQQERKSRGKADRRSRKQRLSKQLRTPSDFIYQGGGNQASPQPSSNFKQSESRVDTLGDSPLDPATALELKTIMSRMKDILRGAQAKSETPSIPTYPPNVRLVCIVHEEGSPKEAAPEAELEAELEAAPEVAPEVALEAALEAAPERQTTGKGSDGLERDRSNGLLLENRIQDRAQVEETLPTKSDSHDILQPKLSSESAEERGKRSTVSSCIVRRRRLTPEEQRIIKYRNRFRSYKERVDKIQQTSERILSTVFREVANELEPSILLDKMYHLELQG